MLHTPFYIASQAVRKRRRLLPDLIELLIVHKHRNDVYFWMYARVYALCEESNNKYCYKSLTTNLSWYSCFSICLIIQFRPQCTLLLVHPISQADKWVISFDSLGMKTELWAKRGDMILTTKSSDESWRKHRAPKVRSRNRILVADVLICQSIKIIWWDTKRHTNKSEKDTCKCIEHAF